MLLDLIVAVAAGAMQTLSSPVAAPVQSAAAAPPSCRPQPNITPICGIAGPEDLVLLPDGKTILVSRMKGDAVHTAGGGLMLFDPAKHSSRLLTVHVEPKPGWGDPACTAPPAQPVSHGLSIVHRDDGAWALLVVNHGGRESVEFLELVPDGTRTRALWRGCVSDPVGVFNDVAGTKGGGFIASVPMTQTLSKSPGGLKTAFSGAIAGYLAKWNPGKSLARLPGSEAPFDNGLQLSADETVVYFAASAARQVRRYDLREQKVTSTADLPFRPDNLTWRADGKLVAAGIADIAGPMACMAAHSPFCNVGFLTAAIDPPTMTASPLHQGEPGIIMMASVALQLGRTLYVGSFAGDRLIAVTLPNIKPR
jgi:hypothetical protein